MRRLISSFLTPERNFDLTVSRKKAVLIACPTAEPIMIGSLASIP
jgi:hypothetical protein